MTIARWPSASGAKKKIETAECFLVKWSLKLEIFPLYFNSIWQCLHAILILDTLSFTIMNSQCCQISDLAFTFTTISNSPRSSAILFMITRVRYLSKSWYPPRCNWSDRSGAFSMKWSLFDTGMIQIVTHQFSLSFFCFCLFLRNYRKLSIVRGTIAIVIDLKKCYRPIAITSKTIAIQRWVDLSLHHYN